MRSRTLTALSAIVALFIVSPWWIYPVFGQQDTAPASAQEPIYMEVISLRNTDPVAIAKAINAGTLPEGTTLVKADSKVKKALRVVGTKDAIDSIKDIVKILDVAPRKITMLVLLERMRFTADGKKSAMVPVGRKTVTATTNTAGSFSVTDDTGSYCAVSVTPHLSQGASDTVLVRVGVRNSKGYTTGTERATLLPKKLQTKRLMGVTFSDNKTLINEIATGNLPARWKETFTVYYTSVKVLE